MQVFSSDVYFTVVTNALLASQKEYYSDLVALVDLGHSFVVIDEHQHRNLKPNTEPVNILLSNNFIRINKNIRLSDLTHFLISNLHTQNVYSWICPYISRHLLSLNPLQARCRRYSRGER
ncbi:hypothetical protein ODW73_23060, partial [Escherichia coli]|nr:hypothetical protein [Escherichia coli]